MRIRINIQISNVVCGYTKFRDRFERMYGKLPTRRAKKKLKSIRHYLINNNEGEAWKQYTKLEAELKANSDLFK